MIKMLKLVHADEIEQDEIEQDEIEQDEIEQDEIEQDEIEQDIDSMLDGARVALTGRFSTMTPARNR